jgi:hypothetical protein
MRLIVLSGCAWSCTGGGQRPPQIAQAAARAGCDVAYYASINGQGFTTPENINVFYNGEWDGLLNWTMKGEPGLAFVCLAKYWNEAQALSQLGWTIAYDMLDDWDAFEAHGDLVGVALTHERDLLDAAQIVTCSAPALQARCARLGRSDAHLVLQGGPTQPVPRMEQHGALPQAIFVGSLWGSWIDWDCLRLLGESKKIRTTIIGDVRANASCPGAEMLGEKPRDEALKYLGAADVGIIPFQHRDICAAVDPVKVWEYAAAGLWTVATTEMEALADRDYVVLVQPKDFVEAIRWAAAYRKLDAPTEEFVRSNSWDARWRQIEKLYVDAPEFKKVEDTRRKFTINWDISQGLKKSEDAWVGAFRAINKTHGLLAIYAMTGYNDIDAETQCIVDRISREFELLIVSEVVTLCPNDACEAGYSSIWVDGNGGVQRCRLDGSKLGSIMWPHIVGRLDKSKECNKEM